MNPLPGAPRPIYLLLIETSVLLNYLQNILIIANTHSDVIQHLEPPVLEYVVLEPPGEADVAADVLLEPRDAEGPQDEP